MVRLLRGALLSFVLASAACAPREFSVRLELITQTCSGPSPLQDVTHLQFRIEGEGIAPPIERLVLASSRALELPGIPPGPRRRIVVRGYDGDPSSAGRLISLGASVPFDVPDVVPLPGEGPRNLNVFLRPVESVTGPSLSIAPENCTGLAQPRAGHTATLLPDGKVLLAGGYRLDAGGVRVALETTELFDPRTGVFAPGPPLGVFNGAGEFTAYPRAFHAAVALPDGRVLITGGESYDALDAATPHETAILFDPDRERFAGFQLRAARSHHAMAVDIRGRVLIVGGWSGSGGLVSELEWWGADSATTSLADQSLARVGMTVAALPDGAIAIAGGRVASFVTELVQFFVFDDEARTFTSNRAPALLAQPRRDAPVVPFGADGQLIALGGFGDLNDGDDGDPGPLLPLASSELIAILELPTVAEGPSVSARGAMCAVPLGDGRIVTVGGREVDEGFFPLSSARVEVMTPTRTGSGAVLGMAPLPVGRYQHTCTLLEDGTLLVTGGLLESGGERTPLSDAWVITPRPASEVEE